MPGFRDGKLEKACLTDEFRWHVNRADKLKRLETARDFIYQKLEVITNREARGSSANVDPIEPGDQIRLWDPAFRKTSFGQTPWAGPF